MTENYRILWTAHARRSIRKCDGPTAARAVKAVAAVAQAPSSASEATADLPTRKVRVGKYRVIVQVDDRERIVYVLEVAHRRSVYR